MLLFVHFSGYLHFSCLNLSVSHFIQNHLDEEPLFLNLVRRLQYLCGFQFHVEECVVLCFIISEGVV